MIWKYVAGVLVVGFLALLLFLYIPDLRFWQKKAEAINTSLADSLRAEQNRSAKMMHELASTVAILADQSQANQQAQDRAASVVPNVTLQVQGLSANTQKLETLEALIRAGYLRASDTTTTGPTVRYSLPASQAIAIMQRVADTTHVTDSLLRNSYVELAYRDRSRGDSLTIIRAFTANNKTTAEQKGWFTGRNKKLRKQSQHPPF